MKDFLLLRPTGEYAEQIREYREEFLAAGDSMDGTGPLRRIDDPEEYIRVCRSYEDPASVPHNRVVATQLMYVRVSDGRLVGMIQLRHSLNEYLSRYAGHIGYSVRPSERRQGYAKAMLRAAIPLCRSFGITKALVTCDEGNIGSEKTILSCGGVYESTVHEPDDNIDIKRFWIDISDPM